MATQPVELPRQDDLPDYLPARMVNEFVYCPRLFFYEWVEGIFRETADTVEGAVQHRRVDKEGGELPPAEELPDDLKTQAITLSSERLRVIAKMDLVQVEDGHARPIDYKHGRPRTPTAAGLWPADRAQIAVQAMVLRENGYRCDEGIVYYRKTNQRVRVAFDEELIQEAEVADANAWKTARQRLIPPPLVDSPKCPGCSLDGICLPDETNALEAVVEEDDGQLSLFFDRRNAAQGSATRGAPLDCPEEERKPVYLNTQGMRVGKSGEVLQVKEKDALRAGDADRRDLPGEPDGERADLDAGGAGVVRGGGPICYFSMGGWFYGITTGLNQKNVFLRRSQFRLASRSSSPVGWRGGWWRGRFGTRGPAAAEPRGAEPARRSAVEARWRSGRSGRRRWRSCWGSRATRRGCTSAISRG